MTRDEAIAKAKIMAAELNRPVYVKPYDGCSHPNLDSTFVLRMTPCTIEGYAKVYPVGVVEEVV